MDMFMSYKTIYWNYVYDIILYSKFYYHKYFGGNIFKNCSTDVKQYLKKAIILILN